MNDRDIVRMLESSLLVRALEGAGGWLRHASAGSVLVPAILRVWRSATSRVGSVILIASITHALLMLAAIAAGDPEGLSPRPARWLWVMVPVAAAVIAAFLIYARDRQRTDVE